jgi:hypothetical protein
MPSARHILLALHGLNSIANRTTSPARCEFSTYLYNMSHDKLTASTSMHNALSMLGLLFIDIYFFFFFFPSVGPCL